MVDTYLRHLPKLVDGLERAILRRDHAELYRLEHQLRRSSATLGALSLTEVCRELATLGSSTTGADLLAWQRRLQRIYARTAVALVEQRTPVPPPPV